MSSQFLSQQNKGLFLKILKGITAGWSISQIEGTLYLVQPGSVRLGSLDKTTKGTHRVSDHDVTE